MSCPDRRYWKTGDIGSGSSGPAFPGTPSGPSTCTVLWSAWIPHICFLHIYDWRPFIITSKILQRTAAALINESAPPPSSPFTSSKYKKWKSFSTPKSYKTIRIRTSFRYSRFIQCSPAIFLCQDVWQYNGGKDYVGLQS